MKKLLLTSALAVLFLPVASFAAPPAQAPNKAVQAPTQAPVQAPNKTAQAAQPNTGYRTYSYMPSTTPANYGYYNNRSNRYPGMFSGFQPADYKVRGQFNGR
jgi:opacity protein-like surface antigen